ncbi:MAG: cyclophilin-like family protein [Planctomycetota bacterium]
MFFGPTPASRGDEIRAASAVNVIGKVKGDLSQLPGVPNRAEVLIEAD